MARVKNVKNREIILYCINLIIVISQGKSLQLTFILYCYTSSHNDTLDAYRDLLCKLPLSGVKFDQKEIFFKVMQPFF